MKKKKKAPIIYREPTPEDIAANRSHLQEIMDRKRPAIVAPPTCRDLEEIGIEPARPSSAKVSKRFAAVSSDRPAEKKPRTGNPNGNKVYSDELIRELHAEYMAAGGSLRDIARKRGIDYMTLSRRFELLGLPKKTTYTTKKPLSALLTIPQAAKIAGVNEETVRRWVRSGDLPTQGEIAGVVAIAKDDLDLFLEKAHAVDR